MKREKNSCIIASNFILTNNKNVEMLKWMEHVFTYTCFPKLLDKSTKLTKGSDKFCHIFMSEAFHILNCNKKKQCYLTYSWGGKKIQQ